MIRIALGICMIYALFVGGAFQYGCENNKPECTKNSDCASSHDSCKEGKCVHDHSHHEQDHKDGGDHQHDGNDHHHDAGHHHDATHHDHVSTHEHHNKEDKHDHPADTKPDANSGVGELKRCDQQRKCGQGLACITFSQGAKEGVCLRSVSCGSGTCGNGYKCATVGQGQGVCIKLCSGSQPCPNNLQCKHLHFTGGHADACVP